MLLNNFQNNTNNNNTNNTNNNNTNNLLWRPYNSRIEDPKIKEINNFNIRDNNILMQPSQLNQNPDISKKVQINEGENINYSEQINDETNNLETDEEYIDQEYENTESNNIITEYEDEINTLSDKEYIITEEDEINKNKLSNFIQKHIFILSIVSSIIIIFIPIIIRSIKNKYIYKQIIKEISLGLTKI